MGTLGEAILDVVRYSDENSSIRETDIISFVESPWGLNRRLFPVQKVILKLLYGLKLDKIRKGVVVTDWKRSTERKFTEEDYVKYIFDKGRCNINCVEEGKEYGEMVLPIGRRSGKTEMASFVVVYETDKLLLKKHPQDYYGITPGDEIKLCAVATGKQQASELYNKTKYYYLSCQRFDPFRSNVTNSYTNFQSQYDIENFGRWGTVENPQMSIRSLYYSCVAKGLRGPGHLIIVLDEFAHFQKNSGQSSSKEVYSSILPSMSAFSEKDPIDKTIPLGPSEGKVIIISSPMGKDDFFYDKFSYGFKNPDLTLCIQAPTWEVNPTIPSSELEKQYLTDPQKFFVEFGAEFSDRTKGWIEDRKTIINCIDRKLTPVTRAVKKTAHFMGIDIGVTKHGDGSALAIGHVDNDKIILDVLDHRVAGVGEFMDYDRLKFDELADWIYDYTKRFRIEEGIMDQWSGVPMEQHLTKKGIKQIEFKRFSPSETTFMFKTFKDLMWDDSIRLYNHDRDHGLLNPEDKLCDYLEELMSLQEERVSRNISEVKAPRGLHDDMSYALVRMVWLASKRLGKKSLVFGTNVNIDSGRVYLGRGMDRNIPGISDRRKFPVRANTRRGRWE